MSVTLKNINMQRKASIKPKVERKLRERKLKKQVGVTQKIIKT